MKIFFILLIFVSCISREKIIKEKQLGLNQLITARQHSNYIKLNKISRSEKRGFADINCDGIEDMLEISNRKEDDGSFFGTRKFSVLVYEGKNVNKKLHFSDTSYKIMLPLDKKYSNYVKIDTAYINKDKCADIVFSYYNTISEQLHLGIALNNGNRTFDSFNQSVEIKKGSSIIEAGQIASVSSEIDGIMDGVMLGIAFNNMFQGLMFGMYFSHDGPNLEDYLKIDWADYNGDGLDDFIVMINRNKSDYALETVIFYNSGEINKNLLYFNKVEKAKVENYWKGGLHISYMDSEDFNGDGKADLIGRSFSRKGEYNIVPLIKKHDKWEESKYFKIKLNHELDVFVKSSKFDSFDINFDGKADIVRMGEVDDNPVISYWLTL